MLFGESCEMGCALLMKHYELLSDIDDMLWTGEGDQWYNVCECGWLMKEMLAIKMKGFNKDNKILFKNHFHNWPIKCY